MVDGPAGSPGETDRANSSDAAADDGQAPTGPASRASEVSRTVAASWRDGGGGTYDAWADTFERDLYATGYRLPAMLAAAVVAHVPPEAGAILDAGCGTGAQAEPLAMLGYRLVGIDLSERMLVHAAGKGIYEALHVAPVGASIKVPGAPFAAVMACGVITPGHAPPEAFDGLIGAVWPGGTIAFTLRDDDGLDPAYAARMAALEGEGHWTRLFRSKPFAGMPYGETGATHRVWAWRRGNGR